MEHRIARATLSGTEHPLVIPEIGADWRATFYAVYARLAPRPSRADKRHRRAVESEVRRLLE